MTPPSIAHVPSKDGQPWPFSIRAPSGANVAVNAPNVSGSAGGRGAGAWAMLIDRDRHTASTMAAGNRIPSRRVIIGAIVRAFGGGGKRPARREQNCRCRQPRWVAGAGGAADVVARPFRRCTRPIELTDLSSAHQPRTAALHNASITRQRRFGSRIADRAARHKSEITQ
jgi:hypothetical protein